MRSTSIRRALGALVTLLLLWGGAAQSCPMCEAAFGETDPTSRAISWSVLFLMAVPYTILGSVGGWLYLSSRRAPGRRRAAVIDLRSASREAPVDVPQGEPS
jgi:hypothetical protein